MKKFHVYNIEVSGPETVMQQTVQTLRRAWNDIAKSGYKSEEQYPVVITIGTCEKNHHFVLSKKRNGSRIYITRLCKARMLGLATHFLQHYSIALRDGDQDMRKEHSTTWAGSEPHVIASRVKSFNDLFDENAETLFPGATADDYEPTVAAIA